MLLRFLFLFFLSYLFFVVLKLVFSWVKRVRRLRSEDRWTRAEEMVLDPQCQSYVPRGEAILRSGHYFCSEECAKVYLSRGKENDQDGGKEDGDGRTSP